MPKSAARAQPKKSSTSRPRATGLKGKKQSKSVHTINAYQAQQTNLQHEADLAALYEVGLTEEQAKELALILGCPWDLLFRWFAKTKTMRTPEVMMDTYGYKDVVTVAQAYVQKHGRPGRPYKGDKPIFGCPAKDMAAKKKVQLRDHLKAKARIAKAAKAKAAKAAKAKPKQTLKSIIGKKKTQSAKANPKVHPPLVETIEDIYEQLASVCFDARVPNQPRFLLQAEVGNTVLIKLNEDDGITARVKVFSVEGAHVTVEASEIPETMAGTIFLRQATKYVRFTRYNIFQVGGL